MRKQFKSMASWHEAQPEHIKRLMEPQVLNLLEKQPSEQKTSILQQDANGQGQASQEEHQPKLPDSIQEGQLQQNHHKAQQQHSVNHPNNHQESHHLLSPDMLQLMIPRLNNQQQQQQQVKHHQEQQQPNPAPLQQVT